MKCRRRTRTPICVRGSLRQLAVEKLAERHQIVLAKETVRRIRTSLLSQEVDI